MTLANSVVAKLAVAFVALATAFALVAPAQAQMTSEEMQAEIDRLTSLIEQLTASLGGGGGSMGGDSMSSSVCPYNWSRDLSTGSTGPDVMKLQQFLNSSEGTRVAATGVGSPGMETDYYGPATAAAVSKMQQMYRTDILAPANLVNPTGYFGPSSRAKANMLCAAAPAPVDPVEPTDPVDPTEPTSPTGDRTLEGGAGSIDDLDLMSEFNNEDVGEGEEEVPVLGLEIEADDASDIMITALDLDFDQNSADEDLNDYIEAVQVWFDGEVIAEFDVDEFDEDDDWDSTVSLPSDVAPIIRGGDTEDVVISVSAIDNLDGLDTGETWDLTVSEVRFRDGDDAVITDDSTGDLPTATRTFTVEDFASAADLELDFNDENDDINDPRILEIDDTDDKDGVTIAAIEVELDGNSEVTIDEMPVLLTVTGATDVDALVQTLYLEVDGTEIGSENVNSAGTTVTVEFEDLDWVLEPGSTYEILVKGDFNPTEDAGVDQGDTIQVDFGETQTDSAAFDAEDENEDNLADADVTGSVTSGPHAIFADAIEVEFTSMSTTINQEDGVGNDTVDFQWNVNIRAFGEEDVYINRAIANIVDAAAGADDAEIVFEIEQSGGAAIVVSGGTITSSADDATGDTGAYGGAYSGEEFFKITRNTDEDFVITVSADNQTDSKQVQAFLENIEWTTDMVDDASGDSDGLTAVVNDYTFEVEDDSETGFKTIN